MVEHTYQPPQGTHCNEYGIKMRRRFENDKGAINLHAFLQVALKSLFTFWTGAPFTLDSVSFVRTTALYQLIPSLIVSAGEKI